MDIINHRRALHQIPELDRCLPRTMDYLKNVLKNLGCEIFVPAQGSLCGWFDFGKSDAIAFRSDADALPILEKNETQYTSKIPGQMHACGHDGHMAILLELAQRLSEKKELPHNVLLIFQCAEETTGGAKDICDSGVLEKYNVKAIFGLHLWPGLTKGQMFSRRNELMCRTCEVKVDFLGRSAHIAKAKEGLDALAAAMEFYQKATALETALPDDIYRLLKFGKLEAGTVCNAIAGKARLEGSLRAFQEDVFESLRSGLLSIAAEVEAGTGCEIAVRFSQGAPAVINPEELYEQVLKIADFEALAEPSMTAEDFSWYQRFVPGMFFFLGLGDVPALHSDNFDFDEKIMTKGADFFEELAEKFL